MKRVLLAFSVPDDKVADVLDQIDSVLDRHGVSPSSTLRQVLSSKYVTDYGDTGDPIDR